MAGITWTSERIGEIMTATLTDNARTILEKRYLSGGESIDGLWDRVSGGNPRFRRLMSELRGMPNSPTLFNLGLGNGCTSSACFVFSFSDSMLDGPRSILNTRNKAAAVAKAGGGVGYYGGHLREKGALIKSVHRKACGPVAVLRDMHGLRSLITQGGKRDLAQMFVLPVWHKDVREFIHCKDSDPKALESFNTSAAWPNEWVDKVQWDKKLLDAATGDCNDETSLWWEQCASAWQTGCPGMFFPDRVNRDNHNMHLGLIEAPNPCLSGSTRVYVADGRGAVPIRDLAEAGVDVPVFCHDDTGEVTVRMMRNPRVTGVKRAVYKVTLDDGTTIRVTKNHKFLLRTNRYRVGQYVEVSQLKPGDSLAILTAYTPEECNPESQSRADRYKTIGFKEAYKCEHELIAEFHQGMVAGQHVHHKNKDRMDNRPENLECLDATTHLSEHAVGLENGNSSGVTNEQLLENGCKLCRSLGRRFSKDEWMEFARENPPLPVNFSQYRVKTIGSFLCFSKRCAALEGVDEHSDINPKRVRVYQAALEAGLDADIVDGVVVVRRACENCGCEFLSRWIRREKGFCSIACANAKQDKRQMITSLAVTNQRKQDKVREDQVTVYLAEKERLGRPLEKKEWVQACRRAGVSAEISRKSSPFRSWANLVETAAAYNHRVVSVKLDGWEDVYNGTVDEFHNFFVGGWDNGLTKKGRRRVVYLSNPQCGETPNRDSEPCNLLSLRLSAYFLSGNRSIDWKALEEDAWTATEFLDDILDRNTFPHPDITRAALLTRKLGLGVMDWASLLAMMHVHYDSEEAIALAGKVMGFIQEVSHACSEKMGKEKGPYLGYSSTLTQAPMRRNETNLSVAPTGSIAIITGCKSWSIEPHYGLDVERVTNEGIRMEEKVTSDLYDGFVPHVASEIGLEWHVRMQAAYQRHVDLGTSKTINLPNSATVEDVSQAYRMMWDLECKGGTIFRDGCRSEQVLRKKDAPSVYALGGLPPKDGLPTEKHPPGVPLPALEAFSSFPKSRKIEESGMVEPGSQAPAEQPDGEEDMSQRFHPSPPPVKRHKPPMTRPGFIHKIDIGQFEGYLTVGTYEDGTPAEIFLEASMEGSTVSGLMDAWAKSVSVALQHGCPLETLVRLHCGMRFEPAGITKNQELPVCSSVADYVFRWMASQFLGKKLNPVPRDATTRAKVMSAVAMGTGGDSGVFCPECGAQCIYGAGCLVCSNKECSWSRCG